MGMAASWRDGPDSQKMPMRLSGKYLLHARHRKTSCFDYIFVWDAIFFEASCLIHLSRRGFQIASATFLRHVRHIINMFSQKEMGRIHAWWVVAMMANKLSVRNWSVRDVPRESVSVDSIWMNPKTSVSGFKAIFFPYPAICGLINGIPKSTLVRTIMLPIQFDVAFEWLKAKTASKYSSRSNSHVVSMTGEA
jgi:hypothetical protein